MTVNRVANLFASSFAQKCMRNSRGCSSSMWLWRAVISIPFFRSSCRTGCVGTVQRIAKEMFG